MVNEMYTPVRKQATSNDNTIALVTENYVTIAISFDLFLLHTQAPLHVYTHTHAHNIAYVYSYFFGHCTTCL